jgi:uncharacterized protein (UPF0332 family)
MMGRDFLVLAKKLAAGGTEADWRSVVSRAYYAAFHVARELLADPHLTPLNDPVLVRAMALTPKSVPR